MPRPTATPTCRFSHEPLARSAGINPDAITALADACGVDRRTVHRWKTVGLTTTAADNAAIAIGSHPAAIWHDWANDITGAA